ncbi:MAG: class I SAM-dependent methyltransferase [Hydrococcus sp. RU_2_2]|nr:class I SAM-dependent methyltransferase [Hydrococcus sp. RU_2_2]NJP22451.1 class I SAM-dependent methyltransferase [Hydrococcus sp. CRU_1_1]
MMNSNKSLGEQNYEQFAERYAAIVETKAHNAYYERPATLSLLPNVQGLQVLDAGCGSGIYTEWLLKHGAQVVACDVTPRMVEIAKQRINHAFPEVMGKQFEIHRADLTQPLTFTADARFDLVLCPLVLDYIADWQAVFGEFFRVLRSRGIFVFSCGHPTADFLYTQRKQLTPGDYFEVEQFVTQWTGFGEPYPKIVSYRRPLQSILNPLVRAGFILDEILEPKPIAEFQQTDPEHYDELMQEPVFLCIRAYKPA